MSLNRLRFARIAAVAVTSVLVWTPAHPAGQGQAGQAGQAGQGQAQGQAQGTGQRGGQGRGANPARDNPVQPVVGTGSISGVVSLDGRGTPVRRARVMLSGGGLRAGQSVTTNDQGVFTFAALPAGRYTLNASKSGYVSVPYGAKRPGRPGTAIQLGEGQKLDRLAISLPRGSVLTGIVIDENGEPSAGTPVRALRYVMRTGEKTLESAGSGTTDDRGLYRIWGLQPGDYIVSAAPRNQGIGNLQQQLQGEIESLLQQAQAMRGAGAGGGGGGRAAGGGGAGGGGGRGAQAGDLGNLIGGRGQNVLDRLDQLQQLAAQQQPQQTVAYAPVYFPGTTVSNNAGTVTLGIGEERTSVDFQLQLVQTATVSGSISSSDGTLPQQGLQLMLVPTNQGGMSPIPGVNGNNARPGQDGKFSFTGVAHGQYTVMARAAIRSGDTNAADAARGGRAAGAPPAPGQGPGGGGRGGGRGGAPTQILWAATEVNVAGQDLTGVVLTLQPGMTISGRVMFEGMSLTPPADLTRVRVSLQTRGQQPFDIGAIPPAQVDATGRFTITGVSPGRYTLQANAPANDQAGGAARGQAQAAGRAGGGAAVQTPQWTLKTAAVQGRDALDFPFEVRPNEEVTGVTLTFTDRTQELSGTLQDGMGRPISDLTIIVFPTDNRYWTPQSRRIQSSRPDNTGKFMFRGLPPGEYRITAVTDVETGEWYDPAFLQQLVGPSTPISLAPGEKKTQDLRLSGGY
jgi:uncharacterized protein (DUF2141 family)